MFKNLKSGRLFAPVLMALPTLSMADDLKIPAGVIEIAAPKPQEISGVAALPPAYNGYAVVGDENHKTGRIWPSGAKWTPSQKSSEKRAKGLEAVDVGIGPDGTEFWLVLGEDNRTLSTNDGRNFKLKKKYKEVCGRGPEGLSVRWNTDHWQIAVLWEGGYYKPKDCEDGLPDQKHDKPKVILFTWKPDADEPEFVRDFELNVTKHPSADQIFRSPDLAWRPAEDQLVVLLASSDKDGEEPHKHTWLQVFDLNGDPVSGIPPYKLEKHWGALETLNWEALDFTLDGTKLIMGHDAKGEDQVLALFPSPF